jgi:cation diffusion facilitator family transporter
MENRLSRIKRTSLLGVGVNVAIAALKIVVGLLASSVAIVSEGMNNAADALTSALTLIGVKLSEKHPDAKHPFGYGRLEYLAALIIAVIILVTGVEMLIESVKGVFHPVNLSISYLSLAVVAGTAVIKFALGVYTIAMGRKAKSKALEAVGLECRNDAFVSAVTIGSCVVFLIWGVSVDAYVAILLSGLIVKTGIGVLRSTVSDLLGRAGDAELAERLYRRIRATEGVINAADMMLHNYGPEAWSGSVNVEIDHRKSVAEVYAILHDLQLRIMHEDKVTMVFGVYAVDNDSEASVKIRQTVAEFVRAHEHVISFHAVYIDPATNKIYCDLVVDYNLKSWDNLRKEFLSYMSKYFGDQEIELTIETEFVMSKTKRKF